ncbi:DivIVA domain-containing protein [Salinispora cortesiana]|uniref:DivIVA domain-containing protein n=1 Tax=Salinispora cortesiana TaxID=1305843 RepID=UPI0003F90C3A|nr:DivIVA domain-containing protein [Salinispora cortesiana]
MGQVLLLLVAALTVAAVVFGVAVLVTGRDSGLVPAEPDGAAVPLPSTRPLRESDVGQVRFDTALRGYRMAQVDQAMRRAAYDIGYKTELIGVLEAEVTALREGRNADAEALLRAREQAVGAHPGGTGDPSGGAAQRSRPHTGEAADEPAEEARSGGEAKPDPEARSGDGTRSDSATGSGGEVAGESVDGTRSADDTRPAGVADSTARSESV